MSNLPTKADERKGIPLFRGVLRYFPDALCAVAECSNAGNKQHHPDAPLHWDKSKSSDEGDALIRHLIDSGTLDTDGIRHSAKVAWRALALLQREIDAERESASATDISPLNNQHEAYINNLRNKERNQLPLSREEILALESADQPLDTYKPHE